MTVLLLTPIGLDNLCWGPSSVSGEDEIRHDFPGFGGRSRWTGELTIERWADDAVSRCSEPVDVIGVSLGGMVAQHIALRHPERVRSLLVACTGAHADAATMRERALALEQDGIEATIEPTLARWFTEQARAAEPPHPGIEYTRRTLGALSAEALADGWRVIATHNAAGRLGRVTVPVTCLAGEQDLAAPPARVQAMAVELPLSRAITIPGPHMLHLECPNAFRQAVHEHLAWVDAQHQ